MAWPFPKAAPAGESDEDRKKREEAEQNAFIERIGVSIDAKLKPLSDKVETWDGRWKKLEEAATAPPQEPPADDHLTDEEKRRKEDQSEKSKILAVAIATNARITEGEVISEVATKFPHFTDKVKEYFANTPLERKAQADYGAYCRNVVKMVVGDALMAGGLTYDAGAKTFFLEPGTGKPGEAAHEFLAGDMTWTDPASGRTLTGRQQLEKLGIDPEDFAKSVKAGVV